MRRHKIAILICLTVVQLAVAKNPTARELLDKYAATVDRCLGSFATKGEFVMDTKWKHVLNPNVKAGRYTSYTKKDFRYDGHRTRYIGYKWGDVGYRKIPKENPIINSDIINTEYRASYSRQQDKPSVIKCHKKPLDPEKVQRKLALAWVGAAAFGFFASEARIDTVLRGCGNAAVRKQTEQVDESNCYVIDADTKYGRYTVWIDLKHGYNLKRMRSIQEQGDRVGRRILPQGYKGVRVLTNMAFKQVDGVWIPTEFIYEADVVYPAQYEMTGQTHGKITEFLINPDHEALRSFELDDYHDGSTVIYFENDRSLSGRYVWKDGKVVDDKGRVVFDPKSKKPSRR